MSDTKIALRVYTMENLRDLWPCYDPSRYLPEDWTGTIRDIALVKEASPYDRLWVINKLAPDYKELFAVRRTYQGDLDELLVHIDSMLDGRGWNGDIEPKRTAANIARAYQSGELHYPPTKLDFGFICLEAIKAESLKIELEDAKSELETESNKAWGWFDEFQSVDIWMINNGLLEEEDLINEKPSGNIIRALQRLLKKTGG